MKRTFASALFLAIAFAMLPSLVHAQGAGISPNGAHGTFTNPTGVNNLTAPITGVNQFQSLACTVINWLFWGVMILAIVMFLVGAYRYATSGGEPEKTGDANRTLLYAAIAVVVAIIAGGVPSIIGSFFSQPVGGTCVAFGGLLGLLGGI